MESGNSACLQGGTASHLLMNGTEREARTRLFNISSTGLSPSNNNAVLTCRGMHLNILQYIITYRHSYARHVECPLETVSSVNWLISYVGTQLTFPCNINSGMVIFYCKCKQSNWYMILL